MTSIEVMEKMMFWLSIHANYNASDMEEWPYWRFQLHFSYLQDHLEKQNKQQRKQQDEMRQKNSMGNPNKYMKSASKGLPKTPSNTKMPKMPKF